MHANMPTQPTRMHTRTHARTRTHIRTPAWNCTSPRPFVAVMADVSLLHADNQIGDAGMTQMAAALKINTAIKTLRLESKSGGCVRVCTLVLACPPKHTHKEAGWARWLAL